MPRRQNRPEHIPKWWEDIPVTAVIVEEPDDPSAVRRIAVCVAPAADPVMSVYLALHAINSFVAGLDPEDKARLASMLTEQPVGEF
jgi:hypothetical protein